MRAAPLQVSGNDATWGVNLGSGLDAWWGVNLGSGLALRDVLWDGLTGSLSNTPMVMTAESLAEKYNTRYRQVSSSNQDGSLLFCGIQRRTISNLILCFRDAHYLLRARTATSLPFEVKHFGGRHQTRPYESVFAFFHFGVCIQVV
jgi:hypothetical protein